MKITHWCKPGLKIKRWILMGIIGILMISIGVYPYFLDIIHYNTQKWIHMTILLIGILLLCYSAIKEIRSILHIIGLSGFSELLSNGIKRKYNLEKGKKIVVIGGGTGLSVILRGIKKVTSNLSAIVTMADDGGGSGILREDLGMLPPGDVRSCILALADTENDMQELLQYRFTEGMLTGQNFGNLLIAALNGMSGSFEEAIIKVHEILRVKGRVIPVTCMDVRLCAELFNGETIKGESKIQSAAITSNSPIKRVFIEPEKPAPIQDAIEAIEDADIIILGPGSLYTSIIPNLLVGGIAEAILKSKAPKILICNMMTQPGETSGYSVYDHVNAVNEYSGNKIVDYVIINNQVIPQESLRKYMEDGAEQLLPSAEDRSRLKKEGVIIAEDNFIDIKRGYIRHDADRIANTVLDILYCRMQKLKS